MPIVESAGGVNSVSHSIRLVELLFNATSPLNVSEIARQLSLPRPTVYRLLKTLGEAGWVMCEGTTYQIGFRLLGLIGGGSRVSVLSHAAQPILHELVRQTGETAHFAVLDAGHVTYIAKLDSSQPLRMSSHVGWRGPLHATGAGKALLAWSSKEIVLGLPDKLEPYTRHTITSREKLLREIEDIRECGFSCDREELMEGLFCVAVPFIVGGSLLGVFSVAGPVSRMTSPLETANIMKRIMSQAVEVHAELTPDFHRKAQ